MDYQTALLDEFKVITFDIRGDCRSDRSSEQMTMIQLADDTKRILDANNIDKAVICGYSNGACIAQEFVLSYPEHTAGLIMIGAYYEVSSFLLEKEYRIGIWAAKNKLMTLLSLALAKNHFRDKELAKVMYKEIKRTNHQMLTNQYTIGLNYSCADRIQEINVPLLLIYGAWDYYIQSYQHLYRRLVSDTEVVYIQRTKHQVPTRSSVECNAIIRGWIRRKNLLRNLK
ncbi:alpha/beta fold hydrolase [Aquibacillus halophilus]|uniref:alpha/beta fold hydrolase n=1 Tax=Aquibacillus halophilus TaxID=930132 RepID=UPI00129B2871|nr:alpha/beta hydrolase [Aquibacillus halophilus]